MRSLYTRAGAFGLDKSNSLVDPSTGFRVQRFGTIGEGDGVNPAFQTAGDTSISVPFGTLIPGEATTSVNLVGNLDANSNIAQQQVLTSAAPYTAGGSASVLATTLNNLDSNLALTDSSGNAGQTSYSNHSQVITTIGTDADTVLRDIEVFDVQGGAHSIKLVFTKRANNEWDVAANMDASEGTFVDNSIEQIVFSDDGALQQVLGTGLGDASMTVQFNGISAPQTFQFSLGSGNSFDGLTHMVTNTSVSAVQDGFAPGTLTSISVGPDGIISGVASNGRIVPIAQLAVASFRNTKGLTATGDNYYEASLNSGDAQIGAATTGGRGIISGGQLESSNVDIAFEFTRLIVAQRGFSANARTITISDEMLEELTNIIR